ncbi:hypothetical protein D3C81_1554920 [compost metagenome]
MPPARSPVWMIWSRWRHWVFAVKRCHPSPRSAVSLWPRAAPMTRMAPRCRSRAGSWAKSRRVRMRLAPPWKCASCSTTCRRGANSCVPNAPSWAISKSGCVRWRWRARMSNFACRTTASRRVVTSPAICIRIRAWAKRSARISRGRHCVWITAPPVCACMAGSPSRSIRGPVPTSSICTSMAVRCAIAASAMQ